MEDSLQWTPPPKPAEAAEQRLVAAILHGQFPIDSHLPGERDLASMLGVTRPTLREALQRMARDGWVDIQHGKPTRVRNYWREGSLGVLATLVQHPEYLPADFVHQLLQVRELLAPTYTRMAVDCQPNAVVELLANRPGQDALPEDFAAFDWLLHQQLTRLSGNPVFTLILNGFQELYPLMALRYFSSPETRQSSSAYYLALLDSASVHEAERAEEITRKVMQVSLQMWKTLETESTVASQNTP